MAEDREVAGIRCMEVLARLSDYLDDELAPAERATVDAHLAGCDWCARFGGEVGQTVQQLRRSLGAPGPVPDPVQRRLRERLDEEIDADREAPSQGS